jgi:cytochrome c5
MRKVKLAWLACAGCLALAAVVWMGCRTQRGPAGPIIHTGEQVPDAPARTVSLEQGWTEAQQQEFWFTSQGSQVVPYDWFLALEQADSEDLISSNANLSKLRFLTNSNGLPVGFAKDMDPKNPVSKAWMGFTCAACHTNQIDTPTASLRIDGAPTLADTFTFFNQVAQGLQATADHDDKFNRFAAKVLGQDHSPASASALRQSLQGLAKARVLRQSEDMPDSPESVPYGHGRLDAFGGIFNQVLGADLDIPANYKPSNAPVSYPFLWDTAQYDLVQWNGIAPNAGIGVLARNVGEILGVFGTVQIVPLHGLKEVRGYKSSAKIVSLGKLEATINALQSPQWPTQYLPPLDPAKVSQGEVLYKNQCASCHAVIDRTDRKLELMAVMTPVADLGTDPTMADNAMSRTAQTGALQGEIDLIGSQTAKTVKKFGAEAAGADVLDNVVINTILGQKEADITAAIDEYIRVKKAPKFNPRSYKARSLNGIWATAPYLHNGSVPNLWELLKPSAQRVKQFNVGSRTYDPVNVGFDTSSASSDFTLDTTLPGNSNAGHEGDRFGTNLTDAEKWALIEYMKSL